MKVAIVGTSNLTEKIYKVLSREEGLELLIYEEEKISDIIEKSKEIGEAVDGIIFTGVGLYSLAVSRHDYGRPCVYASRNIASIANVFFQLYEDYGGFEDLRIGIDTVEEIDLLDFFEEYRIRVKNYKLQAYEYPEEEIDFIERYRDQYKKGEIDCVITASGYVYKKLVEEGIPSYSLMASNGEIREAYESLRMEIERSDLEDKAALVQVFEIKDESYQLATREEKEEMKDILQLYCRELEGMFNLIDDKELIVLSSRKSATTKENLRSLSRIVGESEKLGIHLAVGIGEGETLYQAEENARNAVRRSKLDQGTSIFFYDGSRVVGPVFEEGQMEYTTDVNKDYTELVEKIGISYQYIEKIDSVKKKLGRDDFTSKELSELLLISERTANRLLKKVIESGYGEEVGKEVSLGVGRPRRKIKILF